MAWNPARMRAIRVKRGITMTDLARQLDVTVPTIKRYELGEVEPKINRVVEIATALKTSVAYLVDETKESDPVVTWRDLRPNERKAVLALRNHDLDFLSHAFAEEGRKQMGKK